MLKGEEIKVRVPAAVKAAVQTIAESRFTSESEITREAILEYLAKRGVGAEALRETPGTITPAAPSKPISSYRADKKKSGKLKFQNKDQQ